MSPWTEHDVRALLQIARAGRVTDADRASLGTGRADLTAPDLIVIGRQVTSLMAQWRWEMTAVLHWLNTSHAFAQALQALRGDRAARMRTLRQAHRQRLEQAPDRGLLPGHLCEECCDAPAIALMPAPWGGEMGVCAHCQEGAP
jgi:hypothetical protein